MGNLRILVMHETKTSKNELLLDILHGTSESVNILVYSVRLRVNIW